MAAGSTLQSKRVWRWICERVFLAKRVFSGNRNIDQLPYVHIIIYIYICAYIIYIYICWQNAWAPYKCTKLGPNKSVRPSSHAGGTWAQKSTASTRPGPSWSKALRVVFPIDRQASQPACPCQPEMSIEFRDKVTT